MGRYPRRNLSYVQTHFYLFNEILELNEHSKTKTHPSTYQEKFSNILQHHPDHIYVFTDMIQGQW